MKTVIRLGLLVIWLFSAFSYAQLPVPALSQRVTDLTSTLTPIQITQLEQAIRPFEQQDQQQLVILMVPTLEDEPIELFANRVFKQWQLGQAGKDNGILLVIAKNDRQVRIEIGYGLEGKLTDLQANQIIRRDLLANFKQNNYFEGIIAAIFNISKTVNPSIDQTDIPTDATSSVKQLTDSIFFNQLIGFYTIAFVGSGIISAIAAKLVKRFGSLDAGLRVLASGTLTGVIMFLFAFANQIHVMSCLALSFVSMVISTILFSLLQLRSSLIISKDNRSRRSRSGFSGSSHGSSSRGGSSFRGGGGRSGGGGSSGRW